MKTAFNHRITMAFCVNAIATDDADRRIAALLMPALLLTLWCPAWLYRRLAALPSLAVRLADAGRHEWREWCWTVQTTGLIMQGWLRGAPCA
ncbi:MAG: hypothetical protein KDJ97_27645 [Anaerolineae bacterium]|nr:hypothetical protein [Anaerolineae bacterium]